VGRSIAWNLLIEFQFHWRCILNHLMICDRLHGHVLKIRLWRMINLYCLFHCWIFEIQLMLCRCMGCRWLIVILLLLIHHLWLFLGSLSMRCRNTRYWTYLRQFEEYNVQHRILRLDRKGFILIMGMWWKNYGRN